MAVVGYIDGYVDGNNNEYSLADTTARANKADKVSNATNGNFAGLDANGNLTDSGKKASDFMASDGVEANPAGTATGTLTSLGINGDKYAIQGGGGITKTITVYSAASDTVSFTDMTESKTVTTNASGVGTVSINYIQGQIITFTSSVAKNPDNLSEDYKKTIQILEDDTEVYVMPNNALYWYGYKSSNFEECSTANGWTAKSFTPPTFNANYVQLYSNGGGNFSAVGNKNSISGVTKICAIAKGVTAVQTTYGNIGGHTNKNIGVVWDVFQQITSASMSYYECASTRSYICAAGISGRKLDLYALWYDDGGDDGNYDKADADLIAPVQKSLTAKKAYAVDEQFVYNQTLYKVTQAIARGATITIGTNAILAGCVTEQMRKKEWIKFGSLDIAASSGVSGVTVTNSNGINWQDYDWMMVDVKFTGNGGYLYTIGNQCIPLKMMKDKYNQAGASGSAAQADFMYPICYAEFGTITSRPWTSEGNKLILNASNTTTTAYVADIWLRKE